MRTFACTGHLVGICVCFCRWLVLLVAVVLWSGLLLLLIEKWNRWLVLLIEQWSRWLVLFILHCMASDIVHHVLNTKKDLMK